MGARPRGHGRPAQLPRRLRDRVRFASAVDGSEAQHLGRAHIAVAASAGTAPAPQLCCGRWRAGRCRWRRGWLSTRRRCDEGELGLLFEPRDAVTLAGQLTRLVSEPALLARLAERVEAARPALDWANTAEAFEDLYGRLAARRHPTGGNAAVRERLQEREFIHVDLHMHTDHSHDCATPVDTLLDAAEPRVSARSR